MKLDKYYKILVPVLLKLKERLSKYDFKITGSDTETNPEPYPVTLISPGEFQIKNNFRLHHDIRVEAVRAQFIQYATSGDIITDYSLNASNLPDRIDYPRFYGNLTKGNPVNLINILPGDELDRLNCDIEKLVYSILRSKASRERDYQNINIYSIISKENNLSLVNEIIRLTINSETIALNAFKDFLETLIQELERIYVNTVEYYDIFVYRGDPNEWKGAISGFIPIPYIPRSKSKYNYKSELHLLPFTIDILDKMVDPETLEQMKKEYDKIDKSFTRLLVPRKPKPWSEIHKLPALHIQLYGQVDVTREIHEQVRILLPHLIMSAQMENKVAEKDYFTPIKFLSFNNDSDIIKSKIFFERDTLLFIPLGRNTSRTNLHPDYFNFDNLRNFYLKLDQLKQIYKPLQKNNNLHWNKLAAKFVNALIRIGSSYYQPIPSDNVFQAVCGLENLLLERNTSKYSQRFLEMMLGLLDGGDSQAKIIARLYRSRSRVAHGSVTSLYYHNIIQNQNCNELYDTKDWADEYYLPRTSYEIVWKFLQLLIDDVDNIQRLDAKSIETYLRKTLVTRKI